MNPMHSDRHYIVTGAGGFIGGAIAKALSRSGHRVYAISRGKYPHLENQGIRTFQIDLAQELTSHREIFEGCEAVFHVAAKVEMWGPYREFFQANVLATRNVIRACKEFKIPKLIFTSSPSVIADDSNLCGVDESYPYAKRHLAYYPATKAIAEREVLAANSNELYTVALRPHLVFGPGDTHFVPTILERARSGKLVQIGNGLNRVDFTFVEDCVAAHLLALKALESNPACRGKAYFVTQGDPVPLWGWINQVLQLNGLGTLSKKVPARLAYGLAGLREIAAKLIPGSPQPALTRFLVSEMFTDHFFDISRARRDLGFAPKYTVNEALQATFAQSISPPASLSQA